ncbi:hypothetical protein K353_06175 [Kitasatospora sp. SolWspMP-SS2h]|uniref:hypothetical protein n=1 Tax=Kitasatospora sp. SolWspMP-SS2h TaxID=1305729 RepID=UPI000DB952AB|nr:hypothetical protein [Kitasatospora sp. SolWspMP-SS2h]RAJ31271.1 hypothetical protein K353_06175 [Kitasatospora sp. SolWspMP-SS2h]
MDPLYDSLRFPPPRFDPYPDDAYPDEEEQQTPRIGHQAAPYEMDEREQRALTLAREAGQEAAAWVRELAAHQIRPAHSRALLNAAEAIGVATSAAIVPGGDGQALDDLHRSWLLASSVIGTAYDPAAHPDQASQSLPELTWPEWVALLAVCAAATAMPASVLGYCPPELEALAGALEAAVRSGQGT